RLGADSSHWVPEIFCVGWEWGMTLVTGDMPPADSPVSRGINRSWEWCATPPRGNGASRGDGRTVGLRVRNAGYHAEFHCDGGLVASTRRDHLLAWLQREGPRAPYLDGDLLLRRDY